MKSILSQLLFEPVPEPSRRGRQIKFDVDELDIMISTGPLNERITMLMRIRAYPMCAREIATGIGSNASQVHRGLKSLASRGLIEVVDMPGCAKEYMLKS